MELIATNNKETKRVVMFGDYYHLQRSVCKFIDLWADIKTTQVESQASKWILDNGLRVVDTYPTIAEIRTMQMEVLS